MLQLKHVSKTYQSGSFIQKALDDVSINFRAQEFVAILGQSGSGKTTLLNLIGGLDHYDSGDLLINGKSTKSFNDSDWDAYRNNSVGFVFQSYNLISHLNLIDNVEIGMTLSGVKRNVKRQKAIEALNRVGLHDHLHKKPGQLSGGQMQRVAIARALANDPDIILADEPTGALDSETSVQIMDLIKTIATEKLVIMVTHNADIAQQYADRIIRLADGHVISDTQPLADHKVTSNYALKRTSMNFWTAIKLSWRNIQTKKWRTGLTAFASSIGIIGVALVLALSNGFDAQIGIVESETLSGFPLVIQEGASSFQNGPGDRLGSLTDTESAVNEVSDSQLYPYDEAAEAQVQTNTLTPDYLAYLDGLDQTLLLGKSITRSVNLNLLIQRDTVAVPLAMASVNFAVYPQNSDNLSSYLATNYDVLSGSYPQSATDIVLIIDESNRLDASIVSALGFDETADSIALEDMVGLTLKAIPNDVYYVQEGDLFRINGSPDDLSALYNDPQALELTLVGVLRQKPDVSSAALNPGLAYSDELSERFIADAQDSAIVKAQEAVDYNVITGIPFVASSSTTDSDFGSSNARPNGQTKEEALSSLGATAIPNSISLYPLDFEAKTQVMAYLDAYNTDKALEEQIVYQDLSATITSTMGSVLDAITLVLIAFASISLIVSLIMIAIITYISVLERTKEIGILRALGARKKDITRVFNAETFLTGLIAGSLGLGLAYTLTFPVNSILVNLTGLSNVAVMDPLQALLLFIFSVSLAVVGGLIPARMAAKKDPVAALRSE